MDKVPLSLAFKTAPLLMDTPALLSPKTTFTLAPTVTYWEAVSSAEVLVWLVSLFLSSFFSVFSLSASAAFSSFFFSSSLVASVASLNKSAKPRSSSASLSSGCVLSVPVSLFLSLSLFSSFAASTFAVPLLAVICCSVFVSAAFTSILPPALITALSVTCAFSEVLTKFKAEPPRPDSLMLFSALTVNELFSVEATEIFLAASSVAPAFS